MGLLLVVLDPHESVVSDGDVEGTRLLREVSECVRNNVADVRRNRTNVVVMHGSREENGFQCGQRKARDV